MRRLAWVTAGAAAVVAVAVIAAVALNAPRSGGATPSGGATTAASTPTSASSGASTTPATTGTMQVEFSDPWSHSTAAQYRLHRTQIAAINAAPKGATIHLVMYTLATETVGRALLNAYRRGVHVRMIIDDHENYRWTKRLQAAIGTDQAKDSYVVRCHLACASDIT